jgi:hypothetical protein
MIPDGVLGRYAERKTVDGLRWFTSTAADAATLTPSAGEFSEHRGVVGVQVQRDDASG